MRWESTLPVCLLAFGWMRSALAKDPPEDLVIFTVRLYDYAQVAPETLAEANNHAVRIFREAGVDLRLVACGLSQSESARNPACQGSLNPSVFSLRILSREMAARAQVSAGALGFAWPLIASICFPRVKERSEIEALPRSVILGHVMAHELGHLLLGREHSPNSVMCPSLRGYHLLRACNRALLFDSREVQRIQARLHQQAAVR